jgi:malonyl-CoA O-methyltransferase
MATFISSSAAKMSAPIDVLRVRQMFARPNRVAGSAFMRREVASRMHERLALIKLNPQRVLDAGCGEGADLPILKQRFAQACLFGLDAAEPMLALAREAEELPLWQRLLGKRETTPFLAADFARLPLAAQTLDMVWSNLALHWHPQPDLVLQEWQRVLRFQGLLMFSCFGPDTFQQLRNAMQQAGLNDSILPFVDMHDFGDMLVKAGFAAPVMDMEKITVTYRTTAELIADVRTFGGNPLFKKSGNRFRRQILQSIKQSLEALRDANGVIPLSFEIVYGHAFKPVSKARDEAIIRFDWPRKGL